MMPRSSLTVLLALLLAAFVVCLAFYVPQAHGAPILQAEGQGHVITLTDEPCALPAISNLPRRATWREPSGKVWEACYGSFGNAVIFYCADRTIQVLPVQGFTKVTGI